MNKLKSLLLLLPRTMRRWMHKRRRVREMRELYRRGRPSESSARTVLFWVPGGMPLMLEVEAPIAAALRLRGVNVHAVICDGPFRACVRRTLSDGTPTRRWGDLCPECRTKTSAVLDLMGIPYSFIGDYVSEVQRSDLWERTASSTWETLDELRHGQINVSRNVRSAIVRYLKGEELVGHEEIVREYAFSALVCAEAAGKAIGQLSPSRVFVSHGVYVDWGPALYTALARGVAVSAWMAAYLKWRFYFRHVEDELRIDFHNMSAAAWDARRNIPLTPLEDARLDRYLEDRYHRHISFDMKRLGKYRGQADALRAKYVTRPDRPIFGIMAHINWDCVCDYSPMAYDFFDDWMLDTIREVSTVSDVNWLVKIHPAEAWDNPESGVQRLVERHFPSLPPHVRVIPAEDEISPLDFYELVDGGVTVYGTAGLELTLLGKPVILAGEAHYGGRGFTYDGLDREMYRQLLRKAGSMKALSDEQIRLARQYAYCYFIQRQVPLPVSSDPSSEWWGFQHEKRELLLPGADPFVDFICNHLLDGTDFIMDERLVTLAEEDRGRSN